jgi:hypothetical protein
MKVPGIPGRVHVNDFMLRGTDPDSARLYVEDAADVLRLVDRALGQVGRDRQQVGRWLDFGCGYGRIVRLLVQDLTPPIYLRHKSNRLPGCSLARSRPRRCLGLYDPR